MDANTNMNELLSASQAFMDDERLRIALSRENLRSQTQIWNNKGIIAHLLGDLDAAADGYLRACEISQVIGDRRGEVIALYNLAGIYIDRGMLDQAIQYVEQYLALSRLTGNRLAEAYGPLTLSNVELERGDYDRSETFIHQAMQAAMQNGWPALVEASQTALAQIDLYRWLDERNPIFLERALKGFRASAAANPDEVEVEFYTLLILTKYFSGQADEAQTSLVRLRQHQDESWVSDRWWLELAENVLSGAPLDLVQEQFRSHGFVRADHFIQKVRRRIIEN